jgi:hypothetical protein
MDDGDVMPTPDAPPHVPAGPFLVEEGQRRELDRLVDEGLLERLLPGVVGPAGCSRAAGVRVVAAAWVWGGGEPPPVIDVAVLPGRAVPRGGPVVGHERRMPPQDVAVLPARGDPLSVTTATRTLTDLLRLLPAPEALVAAARLTAVPGVTADGVRACLQRMPRARGVPQARRLVVELPFAQSIRLPVIR